MLKEQSDAVIAHEEKRIEKLGFWNEVDELSSHKVPYHFHPIAFLENVVSSGCYCNRDFSIQELKLIVRRLREVEGYSSYGLFTSSNCRIPQSDKTYARFTEEINRMMRAYDISTCLRKMHFLVQIYHESARLNTAEEYASGTAYNPGQHPDAESNGNKIIGDGPKYKGRGIMQLTWKNNYQSYKNYNGVDCITNYRTISDNLFYAIDSGGWYWRHGSAWGDLNNRADQDDIYYINIGVNGGFNGFKDRIDFSKLLIEIMKINDCPTVNLSKPLGIYKLSTSGMRNTKYIKDNVNNKKRMEGYDD